MVLIIDNEVKIQGKPEECIEFLKKYRETFKEEEPTNIFEEEKNPLLDTWLHTHTSNPLPGVTYTNGSCEDCLYYQQMKGKDVPYIVGDTPCTWCRKMQPYCTSGVGNSSLQSKVTATSGALTDPLDIN